MSLYSNTGPCFSVQRNTDLTYFVHAAVSLPQAGDQEANHNEAEDQQSGHDQAQERHVARTVADVGGRRDGGSCGTGLEVRPAGFMFSPQLNRRRQRDLTLDDLNGERGRSGLPRRHVDRSQLHKKNGYGFKIPHKQTSDVSRDGSPEARRTPSSRPSSGSRSRPRSR